MLRGHSCWTLNISWAISIDNSIQYLTGTHLTIEFGSMYKLDCRYHPRLHTVALRNDTQQAWFHHLQTDCNLKLGNAIDVTAYNLPIPPHTNRRMDYKNYVESQIPDHLPDEQQSRFVTLGEVSLSTPVVSVMPSSETAELESLSAGSLLVILGSGAGLLALVCFILYKVYRKTSHYSSLPLPYTPQAPVSVLVIYPPENSVFQNAVVSLAEFLLGSGCRVDIDLWQRGLLAEMGPMRWLAQQANKADRVLVVCPPYNHNPAPCAPPSRLGHLANVPTAAAYDLFPLVLNMLASQALCPDQIDKFWVLHLGKAPESRDVPVELRGCRKFCLMKDVEKLCRQLHRQQGAMGRFTTGLGRPGADLAHRKNKLSDAVRYLGTQPDFSQSQLGVSVELNCMKENI
ncbi:uncharacterized protein [Osmerus mordax]